MISSIIGSFAAAIACETNGNKPITTDQLTKKISQVQKDSNKYYEKWF